MWRATRRQLETDCDLQAFREDELRLTTVSKCDGRWPERGDVTLSLSLNTL